MAVVLFLEWAQCCSISSTRLNPAGTVLKVTHHGQQRIGAATALVMAHVIAVLPGWYEYVQNLFLIFIYSKVVQIR